MDVNKDLISMATIKPHSAFECSTAKLMKDTIGFAGMDCIKDLTAGTSALSILKDINVGVTADIANSIKDSTSKLSSIVGDLIARL